MSFLWKSALGVMAVASALYIGLIAWLYWNQRRFIYPAPAGDNIAWKPEAGSHTVQIRTIDHLDVRAIYRPARSGRPTILFFHGNGDSLAGSEEATRLFAAQGYGLLLPEYRGYGGNPGSPSEAGLYRDGAAALEWLATQGITAGHTIVIGHSLGSGIASELAATHPVGALVVISGFTSLPEAVQAQLPFVPAGWLVRDRYENRRKILRVACPILILHGSSDTVISPDHASSLAGVRPGTRLEIVPGGGHELVYTADAQARVAAWLGRIA
jgi:pimeloyl-ACP methyl ester carboxylesterase